MEALYPNVPIFWIQMEKNSCFWPEAYSKTVLRVGMLLLGIYGFLIDLFIFVSDNNSFISRLAVSEDCFWLKYFRLLQIPFFDEIDASYFHWISWLENLKLRQFATSQSKSSKRLDFYLTEISVLKLYLHLLTPGKCKQMMWTT